MKEFNSIEEMKPYYDKEKNVFYIEDDIKLNFDLECSWDIIALNITALNINARNINTVNITALNITARNIDAGDIDAGDIKAGDIYAVDINARNIDALDISYYAVCFAYKDIKCTSIKGSRDNCKHFVLDGEIKIKEK